MADRESARRLAARIGRVGVWSFSIERHPASRARDFVREVEGLGFGAMWIPEALGSKEALSHAAVLLSSSGNIVVATGIANVWARDATAMANGGRNLEDAYPGRFLLGIGVSHAPAVERRGHRYERPVHKMREYLDAMDSARYPAPDPGEPPRLLAALGPRMLELAAERALGAHPYFVPVEHTAMARDVLGDEPVLAVEQAAVLETDPERARGIAREHMRHYLKLDNYANNLRRLGWRDEDLGGEGSDALVDAVVAWGDVEAIARRVRAHHERGADHVCLQVLDADPKALPIAQLREIAPAVL